MEALFENKVPAAESGAYGESDLADDGDEFEAEGTGPCGLERVWPLSELQSGYILLIIFAK